MQIKQQTSYTLVLTNIRLSILHWLLSSIHAVVHAVQYLYPQPCFMEQYPSNVIDVLEPVSMELEKNASKPTHQQRR